MKTKEIFKSLIMAFIISFTMIGATTSASGQATGLWEYNDTDSLGYACLTSPLNLYVGWYEASGYVTGDTLNVNINWGDGNIDPFPNNIITANFFGDNISQIAASHTYAAIGWYYITITATDNYSNSFTFIDSVEVDDDCGVVIGNIMFDDGDAMYSAGDIWASGVPVLVTTNLATYGGLTDANGWYNISHIDHTATTYHVEIDPTWLASTGFSVLDPVSGNYDFTTPPINYTNYPFLLNCGSSYNDASITGYGWGFRAGYSDGYVDIYLNSFSCDGTPADIDLSIAFDPMLTVYSSTLPNQNVTGNTLTSNLSGIIGWTWYRIYFTVPGGTPALTPLVFTTNINVTNYTDMNTSNNTYVINSEVRNSWDPNDKSTNKAQAIDANVAEEIYYNVRFQNMGNASAINIVIKDTIDTQFDLNSFRLVALSHTGSYSIDAATRIVTFTFPNIMLPTQSSNDLLSQGFARYKITENTALPIGSELNNTAYIYFDGNSPVITNTTSNVNTSLGVDNIEKPSLVIYPQPSTEIFYIAGINPTDIKTIAIMDGNGKVISKNTKAKINEGIYVGNLATGMYFVSIETTESTFTQKLIIQH